MVGWGAKCSALINIPTYLQCTTVHYSTVKVCSVGPQHEYYKVKSVAIGVAAAIKRLGLVARPPVSCVLFQESRVAVVPFVEQVSTDFRKPAAPLG